MYDLFCPNPDTAYTHFNTINLRKLEKAAQVYSQKATTAESLKELETYLPRFMVFLLECCYPRLSPQVQKQVKEATITIEKKHGSIVKLLELDPKEAKKLGHDFLM